MGVEEESVADQEEVAEAWPEALKRRETGRTERRSEIGAEQAEKCCIVQSEVTDSANVGRRRNIDAVKNHGERADMRSQIDGQQADRCSRPGSEKEN